MPISLPFAWTEMLPATSPGFLIREVFRHMKPLGCKDVEVVQTKKKKMPYTVLLISSSKAQCVAFKGTYKNLKIYICIV